MKKVKDMQWFFERAFFLVVGMYILLNNVVSFDSRWANSQTWKWVVWMINQFIVFGSLFSVWLFIRMRFGGFVLQKDLELDEWQIDEAIARWNKRQTDE